MKILKFGGATTETNEKYKLVADLVSKQKQVVVILSASPSTFTLLKDISTYLYQRNTEGANELLNKLEKDFSTQIDEIFETENVKSEASDVLCNIVQEIRGFFNEVFTLFEERVVVAQGEILSTKLFTLLLKEQGVKADQVSALDFMRIDRNGEPDLNYLKVELSAILKMQKETTVFITQGRICRNSFGEIDNLRGGGSDYTAALIGSAINSEEIQIWSDVDSLQNTPSSVVNQSQDDKLLSFEEAAELAYFGAKMLHPTCIFPAKLANVKVRLMNIYNSNSEGVLISNETELGKIKAVAAKDGITAIRIQSGRMLLAHGFLRRIFEVFEHYRTPIDMLTTSEVGVSVTIDNPRNLEEIIYDLRRYGSVSIDEDMTMISVVGDLNWEKSSLRDKVLDTIKALPIRMLTYGGSDYNISFLVRTAAKEETLRHLNDKLF